MTASVAFLKHFVEKYALKFEAITADNSNPELLASALTTQADRPISPRTVMSIVTRDLKPAVVNSTKDMNSNTTGKSLLAVPASLPNMGTAKRNQPQDGDKTEVAKSPSEKLSQTKSPSRPPSAKNVAKSTSKVQ